MWGLKAGCNWTLYTGKRPPATLQNCSAFGWILGHNIELDELGMLPL
jgi:hypothetical protein